MFGTIQALSTPKLACFCLLELLFLSSAFLGSRLPVEQLRSARRASFSLLPLVVVVCVPFFVLARVPVVIFLGIFRRGLVIVIGGH